VADAGFAGLGQVDRATDVDFVAIERSSTVSTTP
jgi:hypothetical protein